MKKAITKIFLLTMFCFSAFSVYAQNITVKGKVTDAEDKLPLPGVTISLGGGAVGTQTDLEGNYTISAPGTATLIFSYIGYTSQQKPINNATVINIVLSVASRNLEQLVVVGYGTQRRKDLTGSISTVSGEELAKMPSINPVAALQGKVPGLTISTPGAPGSSPIVRIRGVSTTSGSANPIYVVDGIIQNNIDYLNPGDIESIDLLRDPSSVAIYGLRGSNGIIAVTTKKAVRGRTSVNFQTINGIQHVTNTIDVTDAEEFKRLYSAQLVNQGAAPFDFTNYNANTDWQKLILQNAFLTTSSLTISNGGEKSNTVLNLGYNKQDGVVKNSSYEKYIVRLNQEMKINDNIKIGGNVTGLNYIDNPSSATLNNAIWAAPIVAVQEGNNYYAMPSFQRTQVGNPVATLDRYENTQIKKGYHLTGNLFAEVKFLKHFSWKSSVFTDLTFTNSRSYAPLPVTSIYVGENGAPTTTFFDGSVKTSVSQNSSESHNYQQDHTLSYDKEFNGGHRLSILTGFTTLSSSGSSLGATRTDTTLNVPNDPNLWYVGVVNENNPLFNSGTGSSEATAGTFARVSYAYQNKYLLNGTIRRDGNSRFAPQNRWGTFGSLGLGWVASEEEYFKQYLPGIDFLKFRAAYGRLGNATIGSNLYQPGLSTGSAAVFGTNVYPAVQDAYIPDPNLTFEIIEGIDLGVDIRALDNRFNAEVNFYNKTTDGLLTQITLLSTAGNRPYYTNLGKITNKGFEANFGWNDKIGKDFKYSVSANLGYVKNMVNAIGDNINFRLLGNSGNNVTETGQSIGYFYGYKQIGVYQSSADISRMAAFADSQPGDIAYADIDGNGIINSADRTYLGTPFPPYSYGISLSFNYKGFDVAAQGQGVAGNKIYVQRRTVTFSPINFETNRLNAWTGPGTTNVEPILNNARANNYLFSSYFLEPGDYFRVRNLQFGYTFSPVLLKKAGMQSLRIFLSGQNLKTWTKASGYTPEAQISNALASGADYGVYPVPAVYSLGLNVAF